MGINLQRMKRRKYIFRFR